MLIPPFRFSTIERDLYRGAFPCENNFIYLKRLKLRTLVSLVPQPSDAARIAEFCADNDVKHFVFDVEKYKEGELRIDSALARDVLEVCLCVLLMLLD